ncbi:hypothetical protein ABZ502_34185 [Streptomyces abikoensis]|uniref:hypothetical protein n=1 Tax=Streptomyces abikoensis TaxID=97398 RepID=UPI0033E6521C
MRELITFVTMNLMPPLAVFTAWNEYRKRRVRMVLVTVTGAALCGGGMLFEQAWLGLAGFVVLTPPVLVMRRDFRDATQI